MRNLLFALALAAAILSYTMPTQAQDETSTLLAVGETAPEFTLPGATRYGILQDEFSLSDYRGETVVLAFFFRARTRG